MQASSAARSRAGPVVVHDDVGPAHEVVERFAALTVAQVDDDAPLVARQGQQVRRQPLQGMARVRALENASGVAAARLLDLDHVRAQVRE